MKDGPLSKLIITKGGQQATRYTKVIDTLPVFYAGKGYKFINDVIRTNTELVQTTSLPTYPNATLWSNTYHVQVETINPAAIPDPQTLCCPLIAEM